MQSLSPAQQAELKFLRGRVDAAQDLLLSTSPPPHAHLDLWRAREILEQYVTTLRNQGHEL